MRDFAKCMVQHGAFVSPPSLAPPLLSSLIPTQIFDGFPSVLVMLEALPQLIGANGAIELSKLLDTTKLVASLKITFVSICMGAANVMNDLSVCQSKRPIIRSQA